MNGPTDARKAADKSFVELTFEAVLGRRPDAAELSYGIAMSGLPDGVRRYVSELANGPEAELRRRQAAAAPLFVHPGHYYSPICDVDQIRNSDLLQSVAGRQLSGIDLRMEQQEQLFLRLADHFPKIDFAADPGPGRRYFLNNDYYVIGDATILAAFIREFRPRRIVEVGSGFSSAVMLDTLDAMKDDGHRAHCTFVEPYADRLRGLLKDDDGERVSILEAGVQDIDRSVFSSLQRNDILFLDTTHISRTGSDVNHEVFEIMPHLAPGVIVHFHDFFHNFEYPAGWILEQNRSWNEIYLVRAFLMFNDLYEIIFFNHHFAVERQKLAGQRHRGYAEQPGGGLWLRRR